MKLNVLSSLVYLAGIGHLNGQADDNGEGRIINGYPVNPPFKYPWMVAIYRYGEYFCGGVLLAQDTVLTAAHCMGGTIGPLRNFQVQIHRHNLTLEPKQENAKLFSVVDRFVLSDYDDDFYYNDLAVIKLNNTKKTRTAIRLDAKLKHPKGMRTTVLGWGRITPTSAPHPILQEVVLPTYADKDCIEDYAVTNYTIKPEIQICAGFKKGGKDACGGDSGGPLFSYIEDKPTLLGIVSNGGGCAAPNSPGIYTRVAKFRQWILSHLN